MNHFVSSLSFIAKPFVLSIRIDRFTLAVLPTSHVQFHQWKIPARDARGDRSDLARAASLVEPHGIRIGRDPQHGCPGNAGTIYGMPEQHRPHSSAVMIGIHPQVIQLPSMCRGDGAKTHHLIGTTSTPHRIVADELR